MQKITIAGSMRKSWAAFIGIGIFSGIINVLALTGSLYMLQVYDRVLPSRSVPTLIGLTVLMVLLFAAYGVLDYARTRVLSRVGLGVDRDLRERVFGTVLLMPLRARATGDGLQPVRDLDQVRAFLSGLGPTALFDMPWMPVYLALVFVLHPVLGLFATASALLLIALTMLTEKRTGPPSKAAAQSGALRSAYGEAARRNAEVIRALGLDRRISARWSELSQSHINDQIALSDAATGIGSVSKVLRMLLQSGMLGLGAYYAVKGELSSGAIIATTITMSRALAPIEIAIANWKGFVAARQASRRLNALFEKVPDKVEVIGLPRPKKSLAVQNLTVAPPGLATPTLLNVTFALQAGDGLAVIGPSASGKSTLVRALVGAWLPMPRGGSVRLDGATLDQWSPEELGRDIGYLPQDIELFDGTVAENISRFDPDATSEKVIAAARLAGIHEMILQIPEGYTARIGEAGLRLSAGQRQRVGLARALYGDPFLVVLDEPNSNLDAMGDVALTEAIKTARQRGAIVIVVAHRPSAIVGLDKVLALAHGQVQAFGPKDEVLKAVLQPGGGGTAPQPPRPVQ